MVSRDRDMGLGGCRIGVIVSKRYTAARLYTFGEDNEKYKTTSILCQKDQKLELLQF